MSDLPPKNKRGRGCCWTLQGNTNVEVSVHEVFKLPPSYEFFRQPIGGWGQSKWAMGQVGQLVVKEANKMKSRKAGLFMLC